jgi:hypothetical protein
MDDRPWIDSSEGASFDPEALQMLRQAFDQTWMEVKHAFTSSPAAKSAGRVVLAEGILASARAGTRDLGELRASGRRFLAEIFPEEMAGWHT